MTRMRSVCWLLVALVSGCADRERLGPAEAPSEPVAQETIGPAGGVLQTDAFRLTVPAGAFDAAHTLTLFVEQNSSPYAQQSVSDLYRIDGLPLATTDSLRIAVQVKDGSAAGVMLTIGENSRVISEGGARVGWWTLDAADSSGWCIGRIPAHPGNAAFRPGFARPGGARQSPGPVHVAAVRGLLSLTSGGGHFRVTYPTAATTQAKAESLGVYLEQAFALYTTLGFDAGARTAWPVAVSAQLNPVSNYGVTSYPATGDNFIYFEFNTRHMNDPNQLRTTVAHEVLHFFQYLYDPRTAVQIVSDNSPYWWLDEATATWAEVKMAADTAWVSEARAGNELAPLEGLQAGASIDPGEHGYGLSSLIKYLVRVQGEGFIAATYQEYRRSGRHTVPALEDQLTRPYTAFWHEYLGDLLRGGPYRDVTPAMVYQSGPFLLDLQAVGSVASMNVAFHDLSGELFLLHPRASGYPADAALKLKCSGAQCGLTAFRAGSAANEPLVPLGESRDSLVVTDLQGIAAGGHEVLVLVDNSRNEPPTYDQTTPVTLTAEVTETPDIGRVIGAMVDLQYEATWNSGPVVPRQGLFLSTLSGSLTNGQFESSWDSTTTEGMHYVGHISVTVRPSDLGLVSWSAESWWYYPTPGTYNRYRASGTAVPLEYQQDVIIRYWQPGVDACASISDIYVEQVSNGVTTKKLLQFHCNTDSYVTISLLKK
jgi:hypothetical protein